VFKIAHDLVDSPAAVAVAVENVIREFCEENVVYLELRSTPRQTENMTKIEYLETVVETIM
jgi:adenosine deaminase